jgi:hypothetical protein
MICDKYFLSEQYVLPSILKLCSQNLSLTTVSFSSDCRGGERITGQLMGSNNSEETTLRLPLKHWYLYNFTSHLNIHSHKDLKYYTNGCVAPSFGGAKLQNTRPVCYQGSQPTECLCCFVLENCPTRIFAVRKQSRSQRE